MFEKVDKDGKRNVLFDEIIEHQWDGNQVNIQDAFSTNTKGVK